MKIYLSILSVLLAVFLFTGNIWGEPPAGYMDYHDYDEMYTLLTDLTAHPHVTLKTIGYGEYYPYLGIPPLTYDILAIRIGPIVDDDEKDGVPAILLNGGIHGREWLATESLIELARHLAENTANEASGVPELLRRVAVWIIPMSNPAGRRLDDWSGGDPRSFYSCDDSPPEPNTCGNQQYGWRHNADWRHCVYGVDIARNFPVGWSDAYDDCQPDDPPGSDGNAHWRGFATFSTTEAAALSEFVQNHLICMAVDIHTTSQEIWNRWGDDDVAGKKMRQRSVEIWNEGLETLYERIYEKPSTRDRLWIYRYILWLNNRNEFRDQYTLDNTHDYGGGNGQFTAWLEEGQHIQTLALELPVHGSSRYVDSEFQADPADGSNTFHPSDERVRNLIEDAFIPMARYLIEQADAPSRATRFVEQEGEVREVIDGNGSHELDYGILAAKLGREAGSPGLIETRHARLIGPSKDGWYINVPAYDYLPPGEYKLFYWIMNYSRGTRRVGSVDPVPAGNNCRVRVVLKSKDILGPDEWSTDYDSTKEFRLRKLQKENDFFDFAVEHGDHGKKYELTISIKPILDSVFPAKLVDDFIPNDRKVFRFSTFHEDVD